MALFDTTLILTLAFGLGMLHALDADHVMAVSGLASSSPNSSERWSNSLRFCLPWALGHGLVLFVIACAVYLLGMSIPAGLSEIAESLVGGVLILIGLLVIRDLVRRNAHLHFHRHAGTPPHAHWHVHQKPGSHQHDNHEHYSHDLDPHDHEHSAILHGYKHSAVLHGHKRSAILHGHNHSAFIVGMLHGIAGSAPLLALIVAQQKSMLIGLAYVLLFSLGVLLSMLLFGGLLGLLFAWLYQFGNRFVSVLRAGVAGMAIVLGLLLLRGSFA